MYILGLVVLLGVIFVIIYNKLVKQRNMVKEAWSGIDVQLKRRYDLIPNLLNTVKGYMKHEKQVLENITRARAQAIEAKDVKEQGLAENALSGFMKNLFAVVENYPDLKANTNFIHLQETLTEIEGEIQLARRYYNGTVRNYNTSIQTFPAVMVAKLFAFTEEEYFEIEDSTEKSVPKVNFD
ncbi:LemA family protein [candidate division KSB1 bacterium]|nr:LemA family protein [candidate division KSB1 bacterium]